MQQHNNDPKHPMPIVEVEHLTKEYRLGTLTSLRDSLTNLGHRLTGRPPIERERFLALDDVSFTVGKEASSSVVPYAKGSEARWQKNQ